jgi:hypothetical protein
MVRVYWDKLNDEMSFRDLWLECKEGWLICFGGILFPIILFIGGLNYLWNVLEVDNMLDKRGKGIN